MIGRGLRMAAGALALLEAARAAYGLALIHAAMDAAWQAAQ